MAFAIRHLPLGRAIKCCRLRRGVLPGRGVIFRESGNLERISYHYSLGQQNLRSGRKESRWRRGRASSVLSQIRLLMNFGSIGDLTDGQLLERFATGRGEAAELAFAALIERHGPMVWRVCRSVLTDPHDTQDAFQATFLVLVKKARGLWVKDSLGAWLHQVALRTASMP